MRRYLIRVCKLTGHEVALQAVRHTRSQANREAVEVLHTRSPCLLTHQHSFIKDLSIQNDVWTNLHLINETVVHHHSSDMSASYESAISYMATTSTICIQHSPMYPFIYLIYIKHHNLCKCFSNETMKGKNSAHYSYWISVEVNQVRGKKIISGKLS